MNTATLKSIAAVLLAQKHAAKHDYAAPTPVLWGPPGVAKTAAVKGLAKALGIPCRILSVAQCDATDLQGFPVPRDTHVAYLPHKWAADLASAESGILFLDEINTNPLLQPALMKLLLEREAGDIQLPPGIMIIGAGNPVGIGAQVEEFAPPVNNRLAHFDWTLDSDAYLNYLRDGAGGESGSWSWPAIPDEIDATDLQTASNLLQGYLTDHRDRILDLEARHSGNAFPTPRSWDFARLIQAACATMALNDGLTELAVSSVIGKVAASAYLRWCQNVRIQSPESILRGDKIETKNIQMTAFGILGYLKKEYPDNAALPNLWKFVQALDNEGLRELAVAVLSTRHAGRVDPKSGRGEGLWTRATVLGHCPALDQDPAFRAYGASTNDRISGRHRQAAK